MGYKVIDENGIDNNEFDFYLESGFVFGDGDVEPDLVASWISQGRVEVVGGAVAPVIEEEPPTEDNESVG